MMSFDLSTAYVVMGMLYLVMPLSVWYALRGVRARLVAEWCGGGVMFGLGLFILGQRGNWPEWVTFEVAAILVHAAQLLRVTSLSRAIERPLPSYLPIALVVLYALAYTWLRHIASEGTQPHYLLSLMGLTLYFGWIAALAIRLARLDRVVSAWWLALAYAALALVMGLQMYRYFVVGGALHPLRPDWSSIAMVLVGNLTAVVGNIAFMGVFVERAIRKQVVLAAEQAKANESQRLERHLAQLDRARGIGMISASMAHELSQPLSSLRLIAEQAKMEIEAGQSLPERTRVHLNHILERCVHVSEVVDRIRHFVKDQDTQQDPVVLFQVHQKVMALLDPVRRADHIDLKLHMQNPQLTVLGDRVQLSQVLLNVYRNGIEAMAAQSHKAMEVTVWQANEWAHIEVVDNGPGFNAQALAHGNDGFFSTKSGGLGLGLLISRQIIESHGGRMTLTNRPTGGACVLIELPLTAGPWASA